MNDDDGDDNYGEGDDGGNEFDDDDEIHLPLHSTFSNEWDSGSHYPVATTECEPSFLTFIWDVLYSPFDVCLPITSCRCPRISGSGQTGRVMTVSSGAWVVTVEPFPLPREVKGPEAFGKGSELRPCVTH